MCQRQVKHLYLAALFCYIYCSSATTQGQIPKNNFYMDLNGSYKYSYNTGNTGISSEQTANQANEVTGHYSYYENGKPYTVKYSAGVQGYQAEMLDNAAPITTTITQATPATLTHAQSIPTANDVSFNGLSSLQFVQNSLRRMQQQPLRVSYSSQQGEIYHGLDSNALGANIHATTPDTAQVNLNGVNSYNSIAPHRNIAAVNNYNHYAVPVQDHHQHHHHQQQTGINTNAEPYNFAFNTQQMSHSQRADPTGIVEGKYSYYDAAGYHEMRYKAGAGIGFVVLGGNLAKPNADVEAEAEAANNAHDTTTDNADLDVGLNYQNAQQFYSHNQNINNNLDYQGYSSGVTNSLEKFRRFA